METAAIPYTYTDFGAYGVLLRYWQGCFDPDIEQVIVGLCACPGADDLVIGLFAAGVSEARTPEAVLRMLRCLPDGLNELPAPLREHLLLGDLGRPRDDLARIARGAELALAALVAARRRGSSDGEPGEPLA